jgi:hypothetical protein
MALFGYDKYRFNDAQRWKFFRAQCDHARVTIGKA